MDEHGEAEIRERRLGPLPWIVVRGPRRAAFAALGAHAARDVRFVLDQLPDLRALRERLRDERVRARLDAIRAASRARHPAAWEELEALAAGAQVDLDELALLNLRGDLGEPGAGSGCSDLAWSDGKRALVAHNEDDDPVMDGRYRLLTLRLDGEPAVTAWWGPGFLPANTWAVNEHGLLYTVDHLAIAQPLAAPGRHFVARGLQRAASVADALAWLRAEPSAGGFTFTLARLGDPRVVVAETGAGRCAAVEVEPGAAPRWHANHARYLPPGLDRPTAESLARGERLERLAAGVAPGVQGLLGILRSPSPDGVHRTPDGRDAMATHCALVADLAAAELTIAAGRHDPFTVSLTGLASGEGGIERQHDGGLA